MENINNNNLIDSMLNYFGKVGLIFYSLHNDFYDTNPVTLEDIKIYYENLKNGNLLLPININKINHLATCLFYLSQIDKAYVFEFKKNFIINLDVNDEVNEENLIKIFNVIEFDNSFLKSPPERLNYLANYLHKFKYFEKPLDHFLLYKYYDELLYFKVGKYEEAKTENSQLISNIKDEVRQNELTNLIRFIELKNRFIYLKIGLESTFTDIRELTISYEDTYKEMKNLNKSLTIKLGLGLYNLYFKQGRLEDCKKVLKDLEEIYNISFISGKTFKNNIEFYLAVVCRSAYISTLLNNKLSMKNSIDKINKGLTHLKTESSNSSFVLLSAAYDFLLYIMQRNCNIQSGGDEQAMLKCFMQDFIGKNGQPLQRFIVDDKNIQDCLIDLCSLNIVDNDMENKTKILIDNYYNNTKIGKEPKENYYIVSMLTGMYNYIVKINHLMIKETKKLSIDGFRKIIIDYSEKFIYIIKKKLFTDNMLCIPFIKNIIIKTFIAYLGVFEANKDYKKLKDGIISFNEIAKGLGITNADENFYLMTKNHADYYYGTKNYKKAIEYYKKTLEQIDYQDSKLADIYFNLGCAYYKINDIKSCKESLITALKTFKIISNIDEKKKLLVNRKVRITEEILKKLG